MNPNARRPAPGKPINTEYTKQMLQDMQEMLKDFLEYAAHMRALDRKRKNRVAIERLGFICAVLELAGDNPEYLPHWVTLDRFKEEVDIYRDIREILSAARQIELVAQNLEAKYGDMAYSNALEYYSYVGEAVKRGVDGSETMYNILSKFFKPMGNRKNKQLTEKQLIKDVKAVYEGRKDGKIIIENASPKQIGGKKNIIDDTFKQDNSQKESINEELE